MAAQRRAPPRLASVKHKRHLTPNMLRVTFGGDALSGFPTDAASANIKLLLPHEGQTVAAYHASLQGTGSKPIKRTYTVVDFRDDTNELDIDFALHPDSGPATRFAENASGYMVIEVQSEADKREFELPTALRLQWLINPEPGSGNSELADVVTKLAWPDGIPYVWVAAEVSTARILRTFFAKTKMLEPAHRYVSAYWQIGQNEDAFQLVKRQLSD